MHRTNVLMEEEAVSYPFRQSRCSQPSCLVLNMTVCRYHGLPFSLRLFATDPGPMRSFEYPPSHAPSVSQRAPFPTRVMRMILVRPKFFFFFAEDGSSNVTLDVFTSVLGRLAACFPFQAQGEVPARLFPLAFTSPFSSEFEDPRVLSQPAAPPILDRRFWWCQQASLFLWWRPYLRSISLHSIGSPSPRPKKTRRSSLD